MKSMTKLTMLLSLFFVIQFSILNAQDLFTTNEIGLKMLNAPDKDALAIDILPYGTMVEQLGNTRNGYTAIRAIGMKGYVNSDFLQKEKPNATPLSNLFANENLYKSGEFNFDFNPFIPKNEATDCPDGFAEGGWSVTLQGILIKDLKWDGCCCKNTVMSQPAMQKMIGKSWEIDNDQLKITEEEIKLTRNPNNFSPKIDKKTAWVLTSTLNIRASADIKSASVGQLQQNDKVEILEANTSDQIINGIQGKFVKIKSNGKEGYVFDGYLSPIPLPHLKGDATDFENNYISSLEENGFKTLSYTYACTQGDCDENAVGYPITKPYQAFRIAQMLLPNSRLKDGKMYFDEEQNKYVIQFTPASDPNCPDVNLPTLVDDIYKNYIFITTDCYEGLFLDFSNDGYMFIRHTAGY